jgi:pimeloyl-ACP methyl ester carboxylesterase
MQRLVLEGSGLRFDALAWGAPEAPLVLLVHGFPQTAWSWREVAPRLAAAGFRCVAPDVRGVSPGARPAAVSAYAIEALVADVLGWADALAAPRFHLAGHDWGGALAWQVAGRHPERLRSLTVVSTPHPAAFRRALDDAGCDQTQRSAYMPVFRTPGAGEDMFLGRGPDGLRELYLAAGLSETEARVYAGVFQERAALTAFLNWYRAADPATPGGIGPIVTPTLYVWSTGDVALGREAAVWTAEHVAANYRFEILEGVSHWIPEHAPERLAARCLERMRGV